MNGKEILSWFIDCCDPVSMRIVNETGRTVTLQVTMKRSTFETHVDPRLDFDYSPKGEKDWRGELRGIQQVSGKTTRADTTDALYMYDLLIFKF